MGINALADDDLVNGQTSDTMATPDGMTYGTLHFLYSPITHYVVATLESDKDPNGFYSVIYEVNANGIKLTNSAVQFRRYDFNEMLPISQVNPIPPPPPCTAAPTLLSPRDGEVIHQANVTFTWQAPASCSSPSYTLVFTSDGKSIGCAPCLSDAVHIPDRRLQQEPGLVLARSRLPILC
jgi:hypothetical protein